MGVKIPVVSQVVSARAIQKWLLVVQSEVRGERHIQCTVLNMLEQIGGEEQIDDNEWK